MTEAPPRLGPRPLPLHLFSATTTLLSSLAVLPSARRGSLAWKPPLQEAASGLAGALAAVPPNELTDALQREVERRLGAMLAGIARYREHPYRRDLEPPPAVHVEGATRLLEYAPPPGAAAGAVPVLFVPSLVNRGYVLDLSARRSLLRWLAARGVRAWLVEWGAPGPDELSYSLDDYVAGRLARILDRVTGLAGGPVVLAGYCMGGNLAVAAALRRPAAVRALALLATPWDFHAGQESHSLLLSATRQALHASLQMFGQMPVDALQAFFLSLDPLLAARKFAAFAAMDPASEAARDFVALEDWLNDGVALAAKVAEECLVGWYGENRPARLEWRIAGEVVDPRRLDLPALVAIPENDRIVPPASARALAEAIPGARAIVAPSGHIGMVVGRRAEAGLWQPLHDWLLAQAGRPARKRVRRRVAAASLSPVR
jgi:polyhydroxyalkanoate synthase